MKARAMVARRPNSQHNEIYVIKDINLDYTYVFLHRSGNANNPQAQDIRLHKYNHNVVVK